MLKNLLLACLVSFGGFMSTAQAQEAILVDNPMNWEASMMPKPTAEEIEAARWSIVLENDLGVYAYDVDTLGFAQNEAGQIDKDTVNVLVKTVFSNKEILKNLQASYAGKLEAKEKVQYCTMEMQYKLQEGSYTVKLMRVYTNTKREIDVQKKEGVFAPIPEGTFAEALFEICQKYALDVEQAAAAAEK